MKLGKYKGLHVQQPDLTVQDSEVEKVLLRNQRRNAVVIHGEDGKKTVSFQPLDDDFARDFSEHETLDQWRAEIREELVERRQLSAEERMSRSLLDQIIADSRIPVDRRLKQDVFAELYEDFLFDLEEKGMTLETWCKRSGRTEKQLRSRKMDEAVRLIRSESVLHAILAAEGITVSDAEMTEELRLLAEEEDMDCAAFIEQLGEEELDCIRDQLGLDKAMQFVIDHAVITKE
ncbi:MAG: hypothetical protein LUD71_06950 [Clostridiales bacterium]|nr:hypothetical protein [Clostridiales bacterium]